MAATTCGKPTIQDGWAGNTGATHVARKMATAGKTIAKDTNMDKVEYVWIDDGKVKHVVQFREWKALCGQAITTKDVMRFEKLSPLCENCAKIKVLE